MFSLKYFANKYFSLKYWANVGADVIVEFDIPESRTAFIAPAEREAIIQAQDRSVLI